MVSVRAGGATARIGERTGELAVGQEARLTPAGSAAANSSQQPTAPTPPTTPTSSLANELNEALRQNRFERLTATVGPSREIILRGSVTSAADKRRALQIARGLAPATAIKDQVFIVDP